MNMDGLPNWRHTARGWTCGDDDELEFALTARMMRIDIVPIDRWIAELPPGPERDELVWRRALAKSADVNSGRMLAELDGLRLYIKGKSKLVPAAVKGEKFRPGKPKGSLSPLNKAIRAYVRRHPRETAKDVWIALAMRPPHDCTFVDSPRLGKYVESRATGQTIMEWPRFRNVVSEHKPKSATRRR